MFTSDHVTILTGYPKQEGSDVVIAFSVLLPDRAMPTNGNGLVLDQQTLLGLANGAVNTITSETGLVVASVELYVVPSAGSDFNNDEDESNLALILPLTLIPAVVIVGLGAVVG